VQQPKVIRSVQMGSNLTGERNEVNKSGPCFLPGMWGVREDGGLERKAAAVSGQSHPTHDQVSCCCSALKCKPTGVAVLKHCLNRVERVNVLPEPSRAFSTWLFCSETKPAWKI